MFLSKGIHLPMGWSVYYFLMPVLVWIWTDRLWQHCCVFSHHICSEILLLLSLQSPLLSLSLSADLPSVPFSPLIFHHPISPTHREECMRGPEAEEGSPGAGPQREDPTSAWTCGATARTHTAPGEPWVNTHPHAPAHTDRVAHIFYFPPNLLSASCDLTYFDF